MKGTEIKRRLLAFANEHNVERESIEYACSTYNTFMCFEFRFPRIHTREISS